MRVYPGILSIFLVLFAACGRQYDARLTDIETYINDRPDSALAVVTAIDPADLHTRRDRALHSLVYSMALDKCYIDTTDVSVFQPAFDYFRHHGSADHRLKAVYYRARIAENAGDIDLAKEILVRYGDRYVDKAQDLSFAGKYLMKHCEFSKLVYDFEAAIQFASRAKEKYEQIAESRGYATACFGMSSSLICLQEFDKAKEILGQVWRIWDSIDDYRKCAYFRELISIAVFQKNNSLAEELAEECVALCSDMKYMPWVEIMDAYISAGRYAQAMQIVDAAGGFVDKNQESYYTTRLADLYAACGDYKSAYELEKRFVGVSWKDDKRAIESDIRNIETRVLTEVSKVKMRYSIWILGIVSMVILFFAFYLLHVLHGRKQYAEALSRELEKEREELLALKNLSAVNQGTRELIDERLNLINLVLLERVSGNIIIKKRNIQEMDRIIGNRQSFLSSIAILFSVCHPQFIDYLRNNSLDDVEIGYCCLLAQGISAKEIADIFKMPRFYKLSSSIRAKLCMSPNEKNLRNYLLTLLSMDNLV